MKTVGCMANRQIARELRVAPSTIDRQLARLGRHCLLYHTQQMQAAKPASAVVIDGFVSFEHSQFWPFHHHPAIEPGSDLIVYFTDSEVRRSGTMTDAQKRKRERLEQQYGRPDPKAVLKDVTHLLEVVAGGQKHLTVLSDEHQAYPRAIRQLPCEVTHLVTSSKERRDARNRLFPVNLADMLLRHSSANHKRETIAWSKRRQASAERLAVFLVWRNYMKGRKEKVRGSPTPAQVRGMRTDKLEIAELLELESRLFASRIRTTGCRESGGYGWSTTGDGGSKRRQGRTAGGFLLDEGSGGPTPAQVHADGQAEVATRIALPGRWLVLPSAGAEREGAWPPEREPAASLPDAAGHNFSGTTHSPRRCLRQNRTWAAPK
jgi:hypothetical protein